mgnify:CR=1 FL=1
MVGEAALDDSLTSVKMIEKCFKVDVVDAVDVCFERTVSSRSRVDREEMVLVERVEVGRCCWVGVSWQVCFSCAWGCCSCC